MFKAGLPTKFMTPTLRSSLLPIACCLLPSLCLLPFSPVLCETPSNNISAQKFVVTTIEVIGNTILQDEIEELIKPYQNKQITFEDLLELRSAITQLYVDRGYITSGAFIPNNQILSSGLIKIQVVEGDLEKIEINGLQRLTPSYVKERISLRTQKPLNVNSIREALQLLQINPLFEQVIAELKPGTSINRSILVLTLKEAPAFNLGVGIDNYRSPDVGSIQGNIFLEHNNLLGFGDRFLAQYGTTEGLNIYEVNYTLPLTARDTTISFNFGNNDNTTIREEFRDLDIKSETFNYTVSVRQPLIKTPNTEFAIGLDLDLIRNTTYLQGRPFSFSIGAENGKSNLTVIRFFQDWVNRDVTTVLAARSQFSFGINAFDATINNTGTDAEFFAWLGQFQWVEQLSPRILLLARLNAQFTPDSLLSPERFSLGGVESVRGYPQNQILTDNAIFGSMEVRIPLTSDPEVLQIATFFDAGGGWNNQTSNPNPSFIAGIGLGIRWQIIDNLNLRLDYGIPLVPVEKFGNSLQENGFYFSLRYEIF